MLPQRKGVVKNNKLLCKLFSLRFSKTGFIGTVAGGLISKSELELQTTTLCQAQHNKIIMKIFMAAID